MVDFLRGDMANLSSKYKCIPLQAILTTLSEKISGNKPDLIQRVYKHLLRLLQANNDPIASIPIPPPPPQPDMIELVLVCYMILNTPDHKDIHNTSKKR